MVNRYQKQKMDLATALSLAALVLDFEAETATAPEWQREVLEARQVITEAIGRPDPEPFFVSPGSPRRAHGQRANSQTKKLSV